MYSKHKKGKFVPVLLACAAVLVLLGSGIRAKYVTSVPLSGTVTIKGELADNVMKYTSELLGQRAINLSAVTGGKAGGGSEDFAFVSHHVPTVCMFITAGNSEEGYLYGQHNPKVKYDDSILHIGAATYAYLALRLGKA